MAKPPSDRKDIKPRIIGTETEYALFSGMQNMFLDPKAAPTYISNFHIFLETFPRPSLARPNYTGFLYNGGRVYIDTGFHPEYATPECQSARTAVIYERAGQYMMEQAEEFLNACMRNQDLAREYLSDPAFDAYRDAFAEKLNKKYFPVRIFRNNMTLETLPTTPDYVSWGFHENYSIPSRIELAKIEKVMIPFFITRQLYGGSGWLITNNKTGPSLCLAQRPLVMQLTMSSGTTSNRPLINTRDEPHAAGDLLRRLHIIIGDANMSPWAQWLKLAATSLVLDLVEDEMFLEGLDFSPPNNPITLLRDICKDTTFSTPFFMGPKLHTAVSLQRFYLDLVQRYYLVEERREATQEIRNAIAFWQAVLDAIERSDIALLAPFLDNFAKLCLFDTIIQETGLSFKKPAHDRSSSERKKFLEIPFDRLKSLDLMYHRVLRRESVYAKFQNTSLCREERKKFSTRLPFLANEFFTDADIETAWWYPPEGRGRWRGAFIEFAETINRIEPVFSIGIDWSICRFRQREQDSDTLFKNDDPWCEMTADLKSKLDAVRYS